MFKIISLFSAICLSAIITMPARPTKVVDPGFSLIGGDGLPSLIEPPSLSEPISSEEASSYEDYFNCPSVYGPFHVGDPDFNATFEYRLNIPNQTIIERIRVLNSNNTVVYGASKPSKTYADNALNSVSFTIPIRDYLTYQGLTLKFEILNKDRILMREYFATFYPVTTPELSYIYLKNNAYQTNSIAFYGDGVTLREGKELFDFRELGDYIDVDYYYRLDLNSLCFDYESVFSLMYSSMNLIFEDRDHLFPYLTHDGSENVSLKLQIYKKDSHYHFKYENKFYINKRTLQVSDSYRQGFVLTSDFYLPINGKKLFNGKTMYLAFNKLGQSEITVSFPLHYSIDKSLVGLCNDGKHCVGGGSR